MITKKDFYKDISYNPYEWYGAKYYINQCTKKGDIYIFIMEIWVNEKNELCEKLYKKPIIKNKINLDSYLKIIKEGSYLYELHWNGDIPKIIKFRDEKHMDETYEAADHFIKVEKGG